MVVGYHDFRKPPSSEELAHVFFGVLISYWLGYSLRSKIFQTHFEEVWKNPPKSKPKPHFQEGFAGVWTSTLFKTTEIPAVDLKIRVATRQKIITEDATGHLGITNHRGPGRLTTGNFKADSNKRIALTDLVIILKSGPWCWDYANDHFWSLRLVTPSSPEMKVAEGQGEPASCDWFQDCGDPSSKWVRNYRSFLRL